MPTVGLLHPGEMGTAVGACLRERNLTVRWVSAGRSDDTKARAVDAGFADSADLASLLGASSVVFSVCPPHAAVEAADAVARTGYHGIYVDANAIAPATARRVAALVEPAATYVDGGIIGPPPIRSGTTRMYLSGAAAGEVRELFEGTALDAREVAGGIAAASAVKMAYAAWTKGSAALLLTAAGLASAEGVEQTLVEEWGMSQPDLADRLAGADRSAAAKGWRWTGEMDEIAAAMRDAALPDGFHVAAADVYRERPRP